MNTNKLSIKIYATLSFLILLGLTACRTAEGSAIEPVPTETGVEETLEAAPLAAYLSAQDSAQVGSGEPIMLHFVLKNQSQEALYLLKWYTPLEGIAGEIFDVARDGQPLPYQGILASRGNPTPESYILLEPGESATAEVNIATAYDFSQPGIYTIKFRSPRISHIARSEAEMARTVDELDPVDIPSNEVSVEVGGSSASAVLPVRRTTDEAQELIEAYLREQAADKFEQLNLQVEELPVENAWERLQVQIFRVTEGIFQKESFLIGGDRVIQLGTATGGQGLTSLVVSNLDQYGQAELLFTYSCGLGPQLGSGRQARIGMYAPAYAEDQTIEADMAYHGDLSLFTEGNAAVGVREVVSDAEALTLSFGETIGYLAIERQDGDVKLVLRELPAFQPQNEGMVDEELARAALINFFAYLGTGQYDAAADLYADSYEVMIDHNPDIDPSDRAALLRAACKINGAQCLQVASARLQVDPPAPEGQFHFEVQFQREDGSIFSQESCCGETADEGGGQRTFVYRVRKVGEYLFQVLDPPIYAP
ncbi:MAG: hypothetical protein PVG14_08315 [Anaerolineales bacterium]|jgi:hypothetical protein